MNRPDPPASSKSSAPDGHERDATSPAGGDAPLGLRTQKIRIEVARGPDAGAVAELPGPSVTVGGGRDMDLSLSDPTVSKHHLTLRIERDRIRIVDAGSRNGTAIDGVLVRDAYARPDSTLALGNTALRLRMVEEIVELPLSMRDRFGPLLGRSVPMRRVFALLERVAGTDATILVEGETGTGKELVAEGIHQSSPRARGPLVVFDCSAVPGSLMEAELFGQVRGAFTGAEDRRGRLEEAHGGTLFLDEIGELPLDLQPKLLRALERREARRIGSSKPAVRVDVRVLAATNRLLSREVDRGRFREDLYYRLAEVTVRLPPLCERSDDIPMLVQHFAAQAGAPPLAEALVARFAAQAWPGNVRELRNRVRLALSLGAASSGGSAPPAPEEAALVEPLAVRDAEAGVPLLDGRRRLEDVYERAYLARALEREGGNASSAAKRAGVGRKFVQEAIRRHGLRREDRDEERDEEE